MHAIQDRETRLDRKQQIPSRPREVASVNPNSPVRIQPFMRRGVIALLAAAGTLGAAALAWSAPAVITGDPRWAATVSQTPAPSPEENDDYCMQDPNWYLCQHSQEKPITPSPSSDSTDWSQQQGAVRPPLG
ncbi:MAG TPA: hypothetical protein VHV82_16005 [Sporichthyaceae bacterium]|nr:hypothetical protein [Sporichthyaceae bacterium]